MMLMSFLWMSIYVATCMSWDHQQQQQHTLLYVFLLLCVGCEVHMHIHFISCCILSSYVCRHVCVSGYIFMYLFCDTNSLHAVHSDWFV